MPITWKNYLRCRTGAIASSSWCNSRRWRAPGGIDNAPATWAPSWFKLLTEKHRDERKFDRVVEVLYCINSRRYKCAISMEILSQPLLMSKFVVSVRGLSVRLKCLIELKSTSDKCRNTIWNLHHWQQDINYPSSSNHTRLTHLRSLVTAHPPPDV
jgi:hypothetical protein